MAEGYLHPHRQYTTRRSQKLQSWLRRTVRTPHVPGCLEAAELPRRSAPQQYFLAGLQWTVPRQGAGQVPGR
jgi:hypothetical protein